MRCPACGHQKDRVVDSRSVREGRGVRRRRRCAACGHRYTTYEYVEPSTFVVVKKDGRREPYNRQKLVSGILTACEKRPVSREEIDGLVDRVETYLAEKGEREVMSQVIGEAVMRELRELDEVAFVRFASVYRRFKDVGEFLDEVRSLLKE
jgi:transcriptional repressor NrdR